MALVNPIPNQYAKEGVAYSYTFPANTFSGSGLVYKAFINRPIKGRNLPKWLTFNAGTRTFSGTPTKWWEMEMLQVVVEADEAGVKSYSIFILTVGVAANTGRVVWRAGNVPNHQLTLNNIGSFDPNTVTAGQWVTVAPEITKDPLSSATQTKINTIRTRGGFLVWLWNNVNGLKGNLLNAFDFDLVHAGETIAIDFSAGDTYAFTPLGRLWRGLPGKEIYVTNYNQPGNILARTYTGSVNNNFASIRCNRASDTMQDWHIRFIGQPNNHIPFVNMYGLGLKEGISWQIDGSQGYIEAAFMAIHPKTIGMHWKPNTTINNGDRRPWLNRNEWDMNQTHTTMHDCYFDDVGGAEGEAIYLGGGGWYGATVKLYHYNTDGSKVMVVHNGQSVHEYHEVQRFNATHEYIRVEHCIFINSGWDAIQTRCVVKAYRCMYNYIYQTGKSPTANLVQVEGIIHDGVGEIAYNYIEKAVMAGIKMNVLGLDAIHHNIIYNMGFDNYGNPNLPLDGPTKVGYGFYGAARGLVNQDIPQRFIQNYPDYIPTTTYNKDTFQHEVKVRYAGKAYRSVQANNVGHQPDISPSWWDDTHEGDSYIARPDVADADIYMKLFHNTVIQVKTRPQELFLTDHPNTQEWCKNNLYINCGSVTLTGGGDGANKSNNIALLGVTLADYFIDPANKDFRLKAGASAIGAGAVLTGLLNNLDNFQDGFLDYNGMAHANPPSVGAFENGSVIGDLYNWAVNNSGGTVTPPPITVFIGSDRAFNLPQSSITLTAVKSDPARVLNNITWSQISGPANATIVNGNTLSATFNDMQNVGTYKFQISTTDQYGQVATDEVEVTVNPEAVVSVSTFQWYVADDVNGTNKQIIPGANGKSFNPSGYVGQNKWFARGERPVAKTGVLIGQESLSNWVNVA